MKITILSVGKTKSREMQGLEREYSKRISGRFRCELVTVRNDKELMERASQLVGRVVLMDEKGKEMTSVEFAQFIDRASQAETGLTFVIGGAEGIPEELKSKVQQKIRLSSMTLPHEMARVVLIEQLYRAQTIIEGHPYHK
ncbi:MAG: 23S rRNA (pseudouridine(1915)-N(3))-methyltransferase RlmH [Candidatus Kerfeldbacteria bacterium]